VIQVQPELKKIRLSMRQPGSEGGDAARGGGRRDRKPRGPKDVSKYAAMDSEAVLEGKVVSVMSYGAFVQLEAGVDALLHVSHMSDERVEQPSDVVSVGQTVSVRLLEVDESTGRIGVTMRSPGGSKRGGSSSSGGGQQQRGSTRSRDVSPLVNFDSTVLLDGTVKTLLPYGSFVSFAVDGATYEGLVHISAMSEERVEDVNDVLSEGQAVKVRVIDVDTDAGKVSLSMLAAGSAKEERRSSGGRDGGGDEESAEDSFGGGARKKSPRPRFNDAFEDATATEGRVGGSTGESDWQKYLDQYYEKRN
jgi:small subunit ribosomal protein S1